MVPCLALLPFVAAFANAVQLPSTPADDVRSRQVKASTAWWVRLGDQYYYAPPSSALGLSQNVSNYYYGVGSLAGVPAELQHRRVGGEGRYHIFHLPGSATTLQTQVRAAGERRSSMSSLVQLKPGVVLSKRFPDYKLSEIYSDPLEHGIVEGIKAAAHKVITSQEFSDVLTRLVSLPTRSYKNDEGSREAQAFLQNELTSIGLPSCLHRFNAQDRDLANVVAFIPGQTHTSLTLGAHYDSRPFDGSAPGAEDNGSGVAALLLIAKALVESRIKPIHGIYIAFFAAEEPGLFGSAHFVEALLRSGGFTKALVGTSGAQTQCTTGMSPSLLCQECSSDWSSHQAIILDEIAWESENDKGTVNLESKDWPSTKYIMDHLFMANEDSNGEQKLSVIHSNNPFGSDHMSFINKNIPSVLVINAEDQSYPNYHQATDTIDKVSPEYAVKIINMVFAAAVRLAMSNRMAMKSPSFTQKAVEQAAIHRHVVRLPEHTVIG